VVKANAKSIIWYNPKQMPELAQVPESKIQAWDQLVTRVETIAKTGGTPWCMGMGSTPTSGWPGTDWIEDILLHQFGTEIYQKWASGQLPWTSTEVSKAWQDWGGITATTSSRSALLTDWGDAGRSMFTNPPGCYLHHQNSFVIANYQTYSKDLKPGVDFDFFRFPDFNSHLGGAFEVSADLAGMFNDTPQARKLISYLAAAKAQAIWPHSGGGAFSVNKNVTPSVYQDDVSKRITQELTTAKALCYDAADLMPATMRNAFYRAVLEYLSDPNQPKQLNQLLDKLEQVRKITVERKEWLNIPCGQ
jgi:alpha-glucoside transport system substrate-binding protein